MAKLDKKIDKIVLKLKNHLDTDETIHAAVMGDCYSGGIIDTGYKGVFFATDRRLLFFEKRLLGYVLGEFWNYSIISSIYNLPPSDQIRKWYSQPTKHQAFTCTLSDRQGLGNYILGRDSVEAILDHNHKKKDVERFVEFVRDNIGSSPETANQNKQKQPDDVLSQIEKLSELKDKGIITEDEFISKKEKLLTKI